jgi:hypothetical protein
MKVRQHIPNFVNGFEPEEAEVGSLEELRALEFVDRWSTEPGFYRFSVPPRLLSAYPDPPLAGRNRGG